MEETNDSMKPLFMDDCIQNCRCGAAENMKKLIKMYHQKNRDYVLSQSECNHLRKVESQLKKVKRELDEAKSKLRSFEEVASMYSGDDINLMKQQLFAYKKAFDQQKEEMKKSLRQNKEFKIELQKCGEKIDALTLESNAMKKTIDQITFEKDYISNEICCLLNISLPNFECMQKLCEEEASRMMSIQENQSHDTRTIYAVPNKSMIQYIAVPENRMKDVESNPNSTSRNTSLPMAE